MRRRDVLMAVPAVSLASIAMGAVPVAAGATDPHPGWMTEWLVMKAAYPDALTPGGHDTDTSQAIWDRREELARMICDTPAQTLAGVAVKLQLVLNDAEGDFNCGFYETALSGAVGDLVGIGAGARALVEGRA